MSTDLFELKMARRKAMKIANEAQAKAHDVISHSKKYFRKKPKPLILSITVIGALIGLILSIFIQASSKRRASRLEKKQEWFDAALARINKKRPRYRYWPFR